MSFISLLEAGAEAAAQGSAGSPSSTMGFLSTVVPFLLIILIFYFFLIRPQTKKQKETEKMINALKKGDKVVTIGGIHGVVSATKDKTIIVKVDDNCKMEFSRSAIAAVENKDNAKEEPKKDAKTAKKEEAKSTDTAEESKKTSGDKEDTAKENKGDGVNE